MDITFPEKLQPLFSPSRYKVLHGGRGSSKSWSVARALLIKGVEKPIRVLCARELQTSLAESVHKLLADSIVNMGLSHLYEVQRDRIIGSNGTTFAFEGIRRNTTKIKSYEGIDFCWVEEAEKVTDASWQVLIPTIRKPGSEIWITFNPELEEDPTYKRFVKRPPKDAIVIEVNWRDNPWFPDVLYNEMVELRESDYKAYLHVWEGQCLSNLDGAVYGDELDTATTEQRICRVPYDETIPVDVFFDLGWADSTTMWLAQKVGFDYRILEYVEDSQKAINYYLKLLDGKKYVYGTLWLPHDAKARTVGTGRSVEEIVRAAGKRVRIVPKLSIADGINAARAIFPNCHFDEEKCADGLKALRHYRYQLSQRDGSPSREPVHDWASHGSDSFRYLALALKEAPKKEKSEGAMGRLAKRTDRMLQRMTGGTQQTGWLK